MDDVTNIDSTGFDRFEFTPDYDVEVDPEFPADGSWRCAEYAFNREGQVQSEFVSRWGAPRIVRVKPRNRPEWVGMFPAGGLGSLCGVFATPSPDALCIVVDALAFLVRVDRPGDGAVVAHDQVEQIVAAPACGLLLLVRPIDIVAVSAGGVAWKSPRLAVDDLRVTGTDRSGIECTGAALNGEPVTLVVDPSTGRVTSGARLHWPSGTM